MQNDNQAVLASSALKARTKPDKWIRDEIERLDPHVDYARIWQLTMTYYVDDFLMNLIYTLGIPAFTQPPLGSIMMGQVTRKAVDHGQKRADDTLQHFWRWFEYGPADERAQASLAQVNKIHQALAKRQPGTFPARDVIYTSSWIGVAFHRLRLAAGLPGLSDKQRIAAHHFWAGFGSIFWSEDGYVTNYPDSFEAMLKFVEDYEAEDWEKVESGRILGQAINEQFYDAYFPGQLRALGEQLVLSLQTPGIRRLMDMGDPDPQAQKIVLMMLNQYLTLIEDVLPDPELSRPERARLEGIRPPQHIDPPIAKILCPFKGISH
ncbi:MULTISPECIES: oxygenase MpaB family protein [Stenotrophomonas]|uniref:oxygenase MpaB family protein n=1 Tax=Stenotrophomonas TaxID=40323 RepID=UPI00080B6464|nr:MULTISPECIES: oxygenase MpaB family protein [Stenotrophomonas]